MADIAAQREARRKRLALNAESRMNKLLGNTSESDVTTASEMPRENLETAGFEKLSINSNHNKEETQSPYNLRQRGRNLSPPKSSASDEVADISPSQSQSSNAPYKIVEDPEVPDLGEFLASQKAAKAAEEKTRNQNTTTRKARWTVPQYAEAFKIGGCIVSALVSRYSLSLGFTFFFQSIFLPFFIFEIAASYIMHVYQQDMSLLQSKGSLLSSALVLCGIKPELISVYNKIMNHVTLFANDFFTFIFVFILIHVFVG